MARELGDKLGPRLSRLWLSHHLALRRQLAPLEARIAAAGTQHVIDKAGRETAEHYRDVINEMLKYPGDLPDWARLFLQETASGQHQWKSMAGVVGLTGITGGLSTIMANTLAPAVQFVLEHGPNLHVDQNTAAGAAAARIISQGDGVTLAAQAGFTEPNFQILMQLAQQIPDAATLYDMYNRGHISVDQLVGWLERLALPQDLIFPAAQLARAEVSVADAALAVLRGNTTAAEGEAIAARNGYTAADFQLIIGNTGEPPALEEMLMLWRRGLVPTPVLDRAIRQSRVRDEWIPYLHELAVQPPSEAEVIEALVQGQLGRPEAVKRYAEAGGDPTYFQTAFSTAANAPAPEQLAAMANRGIIAWDGTGQGATSWLQGFMEGRWKDKWAPAFRKLAVYLPPPREIATLVREGGLTQDQAMRLWQEHGLTPDMAHMYWTAAHYQRTSHLHTLAIGEITKLYVDKAITRTEAMKMAESVGWTEIDANWLLDLTDLQQERAILEKAISKIHSLYVGHHIDKNAALSTLAALEVSALQANQYIKVWDLERADNVKGLTAAEITDAWYYTLISPQEAQGLLQQDGYTAHDAWLLLNIKNKGPIQNYPDPG